MGAFALPLAVGSSLLQASQTVGAGKAAQVESEVAAKQIELGVTQREADRKATLARALASQTASAGSRGVAAFEGSPLAVLESDIKAEEEATQRDIFQSQLAAMTERAKGRIAKGQARTQAGIGLIGDFTKAAAVS